MRVFTNAVKLTQQFYPGSLKSTTSSPPVKVIFLFTRGLNPLIKTDYNYGYHNDNRHYLLENTDQTTLVSQGSYAINLLENTNQLLCLLKTIATNTKVLQSVHNTIASNKHIHKSELYKD